MTTTVENSCENLRNSWYKIKQSPVIQVFQGLKDNFFNIQMVKSLRDPGNVGLTLLAIKSNPANWHNEIDMTVEFLTDDFY